MLRWRSSGCFLQSESEASPTFSLALLHLYLTVVATALIIDFTAQHNKRPKSLLTFRVDD